MDSPTPGCYATGGASGGFAQKIKKTLRLDGTHLLDNEFFAFNGALMSERENIHSGGQIRQR